MATTYGTGTAGQFTDASQRQVLELGKRVHHYNPDVTPIYTVAGRASTNVTPVPIFEWMEDEFMIKKDVTLSTIAANVKDVTTSSSSQEDGCIVVCERTAQLEAFEVGAIYSATVTAGTTLDTDVTHLMCVRIGLNCEHASAETNMVQFVGMHAGSGTNQWQVEPNATGTDLIVGHATGAVTFKYVTNAGEYYDAGVLVPNVWGNNLTNSQIKGLAVADYFQGYAGGVGWAEGAAVGVETKKKVRRLKNCTQIFREPYTITGTANASKYYGGPELARLQARKLAKIKGDIEYALLTQGAVSLDATAENPSRTFQGFGVGGSAGIVQTLNGETNTTLQITEAGSTPMDAMDDACEHIFHDMMSGSMKKTLFCSNRWLKFITKSVRSETSSQLVAELGSDATAGLRVMKFYGPVGELEFIPHPLLNNALDAYALAIDFSNFAFRPLNSRNMQLRKNIVKDGHDGRTDEWLIEAGPEIRNEQTHAILKLV
jgi:hypothetical protein